MRVGEGPLTAVVRYRTTAGWVYGPGRAVESHSGRFGRSATALVTLRQRPMRLLYLRVETSATRPATQGPRALRTSIRPLDQWPRSKASLAVKRQAPKGKVTRRSAAKQGGIPPLTERQRGAMLYNVSSPAVVVRRPGKRMPPNVTYP